MVIENVNAKREVMLRADKIDLIIELLQSNNRDVSEL
jgi:hypothetical protein